MRKGFFKALIINLYFVLTSAIAGYNRSWVLFGIALFFAFLLAALDEDKPMELPIDKKGKVTHEKGKDKKR